MTSPFQVAATATTAHIKPVAVPGAGGVRSPFQHANNYEPSSSAWGAEATNEEPTGYQPYQAETSVAVGPSYQPDSYAPPQQQQQSVQDDEDDDLGFGNSKPKPKKTEETQDDTVREEKPNAVEEKKEAKNTGWKFFSIFAGSRKEKDATAEERKAVKANLGEQSSFYYDEKEKRWVNKLVSFLFHVL